MVGPTRCFTRCFGLAGSCAGDYFEDRAKLLRAVVVHNSEIVLGGLRQLDTRFESWGSLNWTVQLHSGFSARSACDLGRPRLCRDSARTRRYGPDPRMRQGRATQAAMKWWGWGEEDVRFTHEGKPELAPFIERFLGLDVRVPGTRAMAFEDLDVPAAALASGLTTRLEDAIRATFHRRPRPGGPRAREEPHRPGPTAPWGPGSPAGRRGAPGAESEVAAVVRAAPGRECRDHPVRGRIEHLRQPRGRAG